MKKKLLLLLAITTGFIAQSQSTTNFDLIIDQDFDGHKTDIIYEEADAKKDFDKVFPKFLILTAFQMWLFGVFLLKL